MTDAEPGSEPLVQRALVVVVAAIEAAHAYGRPDLERRLDATRARLLDPAVTVLVVGEFKQGKSSLVNALIDAEVCPVDDDVATSATTVVGFGEVPGAIVVHEQADGEQPTREAIDLEDVADYVSESGNPGNKRGVRLVEVAVPSELLAGGLRLVDTPGVGGLGSVHGAITMSALPIADALVFVTDASQELSAPEFEFLRRSLELCPNVLGVVTKVDLYPEWRRIRDLDLERFLDAGMSIPLVPVSSTVRRLALDSDDRELDEESGYPRLVSYLLDQIVAGASDLEARSAANDLLSVAGQLAATFRTEREALDSPERTAELLRELEATKERVNRLRSDAARWITTLNDGIGDLNSDADHDLRSRMRDVQREAEAAVDADDPANAWAEFEPWLYRRASWEAAESYAFLTRRTRELEELVSEHFREGLGDFEIVATEAHAPAVDADHLGVDAGMEFTTEKLGEKSLSAFRGAYGGVAMFGMAGSMVGLSMLNPLTLPVGLLLGRKALRDEKERKLTMRRQEAKQAVRRYLDELQFSVGKDLRDTLRRVQRQLRDSFQARAEELQQTTNDALAAAQRSAQATEAQRQERLQSVDAELARIELLQGHAAALAPAFAATRSNTAG